MEEARAELSLRALQAGILDTARESLRQHVAELAHAAGYDGSVEVVFGSQP